MLPILHLCPTPHLTVGECPTTHEVICTSTFNEGEAFPPFILVKFHMEMNDERPEAPFNLVIALECQYVSRSRFLSQYGRVSPFSHLFPTSYAPLIYFLRIFNNVFLPSYLLQD